MTELPFCTVVYDGDWHLAFEVGIPELLKFEARQFLDWAIEHSKRDRTTNDLKVLVDYWMKLHADRGELWYDGKLSRWRFLQ